MGLLRRHAGKPVTFNFVIFVKSCGPWPPVYGSLAVQWIRGKKRGQTQIAWPEADAGPVEYTFDEALIVPCTLYQGPDGHFEQKNLQLFIVQADERGKELNTLGGLELDVASFAEPHGQARQEFPVECSPAIWEATGVRPKITLALHVARDGEDPPAAVAAMASAMPAAAFPSSLSTDADSAGPSRNASRMSATPGPDRGPSPAPSTRSAASVAVGPATNAAAWEEKAPAVSSKFDSEGFMLDSDMASSMAVAGAAASEGVGVEQAAGQGVSTLASPTSEKLTPRSEGLGNSSASSPDVAPRGPSSLERPGSGRRFARDNSQSARKWSWRKQSSEAPPAEALPPMEAYTTPEPSGNLSSVGGIASHAQSMSTPEAADLTLPAAAAGAAAAAAVGSPSGSDATERELRTAAALESAVYLVGLGRPKEGGGVPSLKALQTPARRLARSIIIMGPREGQAFALRAFAAIRAAVSSSLGDVQCALGWWSNVVTLRWSFWALCQGSGGSANSPPGEAPRGGHFQWMSESLLPPMVQLEEWLFREMLDTLWAVMLCAATDSAGGSGGGGGGAAKLGVKMNLLRTLSNGAKKKGLAFAADASLSEGAGAHWTVALAAVDAALFAPSRPAAAPRAQLLLLRRQLIRHLFCRLDALLFAHLLGDSPSHPQLDPALLPFQAGSSLTFTAGVQLKMAVGRLGNWAADAGVREGSPSSPTASPATGTAAAGDAGEAVQLFPQLRAAADLAMMPKGALTAEVVRGEVAPSLSAAAACRVLQLLAPEDPAEGRVPPALIKQLKAAGGDGGYAAAARTEHYLATPEAVLLAERLVEPMSLEFEADSDDELSALEENSMGCGRRFQLLRETWSGSRPT